MLLRALTVLLLCALASWVVVHPVLPDNQCGNEQREWHSMAFYKSHYCSVPGWLDWYERANKHICRVHDNNSGIAATMDQREADWRFLCDYIKRSRLPLWSRYVSGYASYAVLRLRAQSKMMSALILQR